MLKHDFSSKKELVSGILARGIFMYVSLLFFADRFDSSVVDSLKRPQIHPKFYTQYWMSIEMCLVALSLCIINIFWWCVVPRLPR